MHLDALLLQLQGSGQKLHHLGSLVTLQLDHLAQLGVLHNVAVASKVLLQHAQDALLVILLRQSLHSGQGLATVPLLDTDVDVVGRLSVIIASVGKRV